MNTDWVMVGFAVFIVVATIGLFITGRKQSQTPCPSHTDLISYTKLMLSGAEDLARKDFPEVHKHLKGCYLCWGKAERVFPAL